MTRAWQTLWLTSVLMTALACSAQGEQGELLVLPGMAFSVPFDPYDPNPLTEDGATLMTPPPGTVPVGGRRFAYGPSREEQTRAGVELVSPLVTSA